MLSPSWKRKEAGKTPKVQQKAQVLCEFFGVFWKVSSYFLVFFWKVLLICLRVFFCRFFLYICLVVFWQVLLIYLFGVFFWKVLLIYLFGVFFGQALQVLLIYVFFFEGFFLFSRRFL